METQTKIQANKRAQTSTVPYETEDYALHETGQDSYTNISYEEELKSNREFLGEIEKKLIEYAEDPCETLLEKEKKKNDLESMVGTEGNLSLNGNLREPKWYEVVGEIGKDTYNVTKEIGKGTYNFAKSVVESIYFAPTHIRKNLDILEKENKAFDINPAFGNYESFKIMYSLYSGAFHFLAGIMANNMFPFTQPNSRNIVNSYLGAVVATNVLSGAYEIYRAKKNEMMGKRKKEDIKSLSSTMCQQVKGLQEAFDCYKKTIEKLEK
ncbi:MAG: hypothetical protein WC781_02695 [Candidatus Pacearchaeota archaeon]|jgi:hypothetical protein